MYKLGAYNQDNRMSDLVCDNYPVLLVMSRFGIALGFGDKTIGQVCEECEVHTGTFLAWSIYCSTRVMPKIIRAIYR